MYEYKVLEIIKIIDGDTATFRLDLGMNVNIVEKIRFSEINTPEIRGEEREQGLISKAYVKQRLEEAFENNIDIIIKTSKDNKGRYGRYIGEIFIDSISLNEELITKGLAEYYK